jgi:RNA polymerase sigma factor (sigma-70 family)
MKDYRNIYRTENIQRFFKDIANVKYNPLDDSIIREMFEDRDTYRDLIVNANIRLVVSIAKTYDNGDKIMDYTQEGIEGLMEAIDKYNPKQVSKFSSYAAYWIRAKMSMFCRETSVVQKSNIGKIGSKAVKFQERYFKENMCEATPAEIIKHLSDECGIDILHEDEVISLDVKSINAELDNEGDFTVESSGEFAIRTASDNGFIKKMNDEDLSESLRIMMGTLTEKEREYITRYICNDEPYESIARDLNIGVERVRQIVVGGLKKMKNCEFAKKHFGCYLK